MSEEKTQYQSSAELEKARDLSLEPTKPPAQIDGYRINDFLGSGAYGEVWSGVDKNTGRRVAIKFYTRRTSSDVAQLAQEVEKLVVLAADRYVVQLLDVGWDSTPPYYVMDYIEHGSLEDRLKARTQFPANESVELFEEIATGLMRLHGKGVLHCDIKPGNILLDQDSKPRLADFGQSRLSSDGTAALGTLYYMAPEQADLDAVPDGRWDVYALGALLYNMLTGQPPYRDLDLSKQIEQTSDIRKRLKLYRDRISRAAKPTAHRKIAGVDRALADIVDRCIEADPKKRFGSVQSVLMALQQRRHSIAFRPLMTLGILGPLLLMALMAGFGWYAYNRSVGDTDAAVTQKAIESNKFAAKLAASNASNEIDKYFRVVKQWASDSSLQKSLANAFDDVEFTDIRYQLTDPNQNLDPELDSTRNNLKQHRIHKELQRDLVRKLKTMPGGAASWWVYDSFGTQIASQFRNGATTQTVGKNYSYRSYFTGLKNDLIDSSPNAPRKFYVVADVDKRPHATQPHLSSVFFSDATSTWKIAFSSPVFDDGQFVGVVGLTVEMGDFIKFDSGKGQVQYAMMVDGREGMHQGIVLEHPFFDDWLESHPRLDETITHLQVNIDDLLHEKAEFHDPIGETELGMAYNGERIAAAWTIEHTSPEVLGDEMEESKPENQRTSGLYVVAVEDYQQIIGPAKKLGRQLVWLGTLAIVMVVLVALALWLLVLKSTRQATGSFARAFTGGETLPNANPSSMHSMETIGVPEGQRGDRKTG